MKKKSVSHLITKVSGGSADEYLAQCFGDRFTEYRRLWSLPESTGESLDFPVHLDFEINDICNQKCLMCPRNDANLSRIPGITVNSGQRLGFDVFCRIIDEATAKGTRSINLGAFAEPLIHQDLIRMVKYAHEHGIIDSILITNGILLNPQISEDLIESGLTRLYVSLDAFKPETYRQIRGHGFEKAKENLLRFMRLRHAHKKGSLPWVRVSFVEMAQNVAEKDDFINFWRDKVDQVDIQQFSMPDFIIDRAVLKNNKRHSCLDPWRRLAIRASGDILPCCAFRGELLKLGNICSMTLEEAWRSRKMQEIRKGITNDSLEACSVCQRV